MACRIIFEDETENQNLNNIILHEELIIKDEVEDKYSQDHTQEKENLDFTDTNSDTECKDTKDSEQLESVVLLNSQLTKTNEIPIENEGNSQSEGNNGMGKRKIKTEPEMLGIDIDIKEDIDSRVDVLGYKKEQIRKCKWRKTEQRLQVRDAVDMPHGQGLETTLRPRRERRWPPDYEYNFHVGNRGRGRGRVRGSRGGRGTGAGDQAPDQEEEVGRGRGRAAEKRMVATLSPSSKKRHLLRKREAETRIVLMPNASERENRARSPSPVRDPCIYLPGVELPAEVAEGPSAPLVEPSYRPATWEPRVGPSVEPQPGPSRASPEGTSSEPHPGPESEGVVFEFIGFEESTPLRLGVAAEEKVRNTREQPRLLTIGLNDSNEEQVMEDWVQSELDSDDDNADDNDLNRDLDTDITRPNVPVVRSAMTDLASSADYRPDEFDILVLEDRQNDEALRSLAPATAYDFSWGKSETIFQGQPETFTGTPGPTFEMTDQTSILDVFLKMVDVEFIDMLVDVTNKYARQKIENLILTDNLPNHARLRLWTPTDRDEIYTFLAVVILQGLYPLPEEGQYFKFNGFGTMPYFKKIMKYDRFILLKSMMHFATDKTNSRLWKIDRVTDYFNHKFSSLYYPSKEIAVDESLLKWNGRLSIAQKISSKTAKLGVKTYELCESSTGYLWRFIVHAGKRGTDSQTATDSQPTLANDRRDEDWASQDRFLTTGAADEVRPGNATALIVYKLVEPLLYRGHTLIMDNFYNSPLLARCLKRQKTDCYGTLRLNREFVPDSLRTLTKTDFRHGEVITSYCSDVSVMVWRNSSLISMLSTYHRTRIGAAHKYDRLTYKPSIVLDYNKSMRGVDRKDQCLSAFPMERSSNHEWYKKLFWRLLNAAIFNTYVIYSTRHPTVPQRRFRILLAEDLLRTYRRLDLTANAMTTLTVMPVVARRQTGRVGCVVEGNHFAENSGSYHTCCLLCSKAKVRRRTGWRCSTCQVNLCMPDCFRVYHSRLT